MLRLMGLYEFITIFKRLNSSNVSYHTDVGRVFTLINIYIVEPSSSSGVDRGWLSGMATLRSVELC